MLSEGLIGAIVGGAASITGSFLSFGGVLYSANHMEAPVDNSVYNITLPPVDTGPNYQAILVLAIVLVVLIIAGALMFKFL
jgi:branched-subunit amino acid ABC-type transport system permease component